jgi:hypothetical protein
MYKVLGSIPQYCKKKEEEREERGRRGGGRVII